MGCIFCVIGIGSGLLFVKKMGIDEYIVAIWVSGMNTALAFYLADLVKKKIPGLRFLLSGILYLVTFVYLKKSGQISNRVFLGLTVGMEVFFVAHFIERFIFFKNKNKSLIAFQKVIFPIAFLILASLTAASAAF